MSHRVFTGTVIRASMQKTVLVRVNRRVRHPRYSKIVTTSRTFPVHDEHGAAKVGEIVTFMETRPLSKTKRWKLVEKKA